MITVGVKSEWAGRSIGFVEVRKNCNEPVEFATVEDAIAHAATLKGSERRVYQDRQIVAEWKSVRDRKTGRRHISRIK